MAEQLKSVGLDVGTTSTQMIVSELTVSNQASSFAVPELQISDRKILYESPVYLTPLLDEDHIDGEGIRQIVAREYANAGLTREAVQTGAMIITGETSRKENAQAVLEALSDYAGDFVVATAGPDLESRLAAKGSGAVERSEKTDSQILHMDIGGGTSNLALMKDGKILDTGCFNVGGRLVKYDENHVITWVSPSAADLFPGRPGETVREDQLQALAEALTQILEMAAGLRPADQRLQKQITREGKALNPELLKERPVLSFSGGVADCMETVRPWDAFGDLGLFLGSAIRRSRLCEGPYVLGKQTIRATVIGAGCHSAQLSGSTVFYQNVKFPLKNLPAVVPGGETTEEEIRSAMDRLEGDGVLVLPALEAPDYESLRHLAEKFGNAMEGRPVYLALQQDAAKALGQLLALRLGRDAEILCIDRVRLGAESYLDVGVPVGPAIPVVVKTLVLGGSQERSSV